MTLYINASTANVSSVLSADDCDGCCAVSPKAIELKFSGKQRRRSSSVLAENIAIYEFSRAYPIRIADKMSASVIQRFRCKTYYISDRDWKIERMTRISVLLVRLFESAIYIYISYIARTSVLQCPNTMYIT